MYPYLKLSVKNERGMRTMSENEQISMADWNPEMPFFPKKDIPFGKIMETEIVRGYAERDGKRMVYYVETYDNNFGNRRLQITNTQAMKLKDCGVPFKIAIQTSPKVVDGKDCVSLKLSLNRKEWF